MFYTFHVALIGRGSDTQRPKTSDNHWVQAKRNALCSKGFLLALMQIVLDGYAGLIVVESKWDTIFTSICFTGNMKRF